MYILFCNNVAFEKYFLKIYRRLYREINPDFELTYFLSEKTKFQNSPKFAGSVTWKRDNLPDISIGLMQQKIDHHSEAWPYMVGKTASFFEILEKENIELSQLSSVSIYKPNKHFEETEIMNYLIGSEVLNFVQQLGLRTAEMHIALASDKTEKSFSPRNFNEDYSVWLKNRMLYQFQNRLNTIENNLHKLDEATLSMARTFLDSKKIVRKRFVDFDWTALKQSPKLDDPDEIKKAREKDERTKVKH